MTKGIPFRWYLGTLLFLATLINYLDRQTLSIAIPVIRDEFHFTNADYSRIVFAFLLAYTIMQVISGKVIDRLGTRRGLTVFITWWSLAAILHAFAGGAAGFSVLRFLLGMGEAGNWPGAVKAVAEWFPAKERAIAAGYFNSGSSIGAVIAPPLISWTVVTVGWRSAFVVTGCLGLLWIVAWLRVSGAPEQVPVGQGKDSIEVATISWLGLFRHRQLWALMLGRVLSDPVWWFYVFWLPEYLRRQRNFSMSMIGLLAWIPFFAAGLGGLFGGGLSSYLVRRGVSLNMARKSVLLGSATAMLAGIPAVFVANATVSLAFISLATFAYASWAAVFIALPTDIFPKTVVASVYGIAGTAAGLGGMLFTLITGIVVDKFSYVPIFIAAGVLPLIAAVGLVLLLGPVAALRTEGLPQAAAPAGGAR